MGKLIDKIRLQNELRDASLKFMDSGGNCSELLEMWTICIVKIAVSAMKEEHIKNPDKAAHDFGKLITMELIDFCNDINDKKKAYH